MLQLDSRQIELVRLIANGSTKASAARALTISPGRASQLLAVACRRLGLPGDMTAIRADPQAYLTKLPQQPAPHSAGLRNSLERELVHRFQLPSGASVTPELLSNYSASQLGTIGLSTIAIGQINAWLQQHGKHLKRGPLSKPELKALASAIDLLQAYHFDVTAARKQLQGELAGEG